MRKCGRAVVQPVHFRRALWLILLSLVLLCTAAGAEGGRVVWQEAEATSLAGDKGLDLFLLPLTGADCMLLHSDNQWMMVDAGNEGDYPLIRDTLEALGVRRIDILFNTHPHSDHIGSAKFLAADYEVGRFVTSFPLDYKDKSVQQASTIAQLVMHHVPIEHLDDGDTFPFGEAACQVLRIPPSSYYTTNDLSTLLLIRHGDTRMLLAADATRTTQHLLTRAYGSALKADLLKYPHHGVEKLLPAFQEAVSPSFALIPHGAGESRPAQEVLNKMGTPYRYATWGLIHVQSNGEQLFVSQHLTEEGQKYQQRALKAE